MEIRLSQGQQDAAVDDRKRRNRSDRDHGFDHGQERFGRLELLQLLVDLGVEVRGVVTTSQASSFHFVSSVRRHRRSPGALRVGVPGATSSATEKS